MQGSGRHLPFLPGLVAILFVALASLWSAAIPPFETPDEPGHARFVSFLMEHGRLPVAGEEAPGEAHQPPLYYALAAAAARGAGLDPIRVEPIRNPHFRWYGGDRENKYLHDGAENATTLRLLRLLSVAMGAGTVALVYRMARSAGIGVEGAAAAAAFAAFLPQFTFISGSLNNDNLANLLSAAALACLAAAIRPDGTRRAWLAAGLFTGLGLLAKFTGLALLACGLIALTIAGRRAGGALRGRAAAFFLPAILAPAPLWIRNAVALGDPLGISAQARTLPNLLDPKPLGSTYFVTEFPVVLFESFWGRFGWMSFRLPAVCYVAALAAVLAAAAGLALRWARRRESPAPPAFALFGAACALQIAQVVVYNLSFTQAQGRFLFPALGPIAILFSAGIGELAARLRIGALTGARAAALIAALAGLNLCVLMLAVEPAYRIAQTAVERP